RWNLVDSRVILNRLTVMVRQGCMIRRGLMSRRELVDGGLFVGSMMAVVRWRGYVRLHSGEGSQIVRSRKISGEISGKEMSNTVTMDCRLENSLLFCTGGTWR